MTDLRKAAEMALEALSFFGNNATNPAEEFITSKAIVALRQALAQPEEISDYHEGWEEGFKAGLAKAQPEQEPVAWLHPDKKVDVVVPSKIAWFDKPLPLYTAPPSKPWVSLTDEDFDNIYKRHDTYDSFARAIEAKLKEKNT